MREARTVASSLGSLYIIIYLLCFGYLSIVFANKIMKLKNKLRRLDCQQLIDLAAS